MRELFTGFLSVSLSGSLIISLVVLLRLVFRKAPKAIFCLLWLLVFARLLVPFQIEASWSLQPETLPFSAESLQPPAQTVFEAVGTVPGETIYSTHVLPQQKHVDLTGISGWIWCIGTAGMLLYALISYLRLKGRVREAVLVSVNVYECAGLESAFLLGYTTPKIYLPTGMEAATQELVIRHEKAHIRRLDNWLKLFGFVCLSVHWFNPLVWAAYLLMCADVEVACDELVVRDLSTEERKCYSEALLACGKQRSVLSACPVAFGEISIRQRILKVLNYRKPSLWISTVVVIAIALLVVFFMTDPMQKHPPYYDKLMDLLGEPVETITRELEISEEELVDLTSSGYIYETPIAVDYQGVPFKVRLWFDRGNGLLCSFEYVARYEGDYTQIVRPASAIAQHLLSAHGKVYQWEQKSAEEREFITSEEGIRFLFEERPERIYGDQWDLTRHASKKAKTYLDQIEISSYWQEQYAQKARMYGISPHFYLTYKVYSVPEEHASYIVLSYNTGWQPGSYYATVTSDLYKAAYSEPRSWWETVLDWLK